MAERDYSGRRPEVPRDWAVRTARFGDSDAAWRPVPTELNDAERRRQHSLRLAARVQSAIVTVVLDRMETAGVPDQSGLARRSGLSASVVSRLLNGATPMSLAHLAALDLALMERGEALLSDLLTGRHGDPRGIHS